jgi:hypothetical protein
MFLQIFETLDAEIRSALNSIGVESDFSEDNWVQDTADFEYTDNHGGLTRYLQQSRDCVQVFPSEVEATTEPFKQPIEYRLEVKTTESKRWNEPFVLTENQTEIVCPEKPSF